jgi:hypothetical protein
MRIITSKRRALIAKICLLVAVTGTLFVGGCFTDEHGGHEHHIVDRVDSAR